MANETDSSGEVKVSRQIKHLAFVREAQVDLNKYDVVVSRSQAAIGILLLSSASGVAMFYLDMETVAYAIGGIFAVYVSYYTVSIVVTLDWIHEVMSMRTLHTLGACSLFMFIGPSLAMLNKHIMQDLKFGYPLSVSLLGLSSSAVFSRIWVGLGLAVVRDESREVVAGCKWFRTALPIGFLWALTLSTGNAVYMHLGVGFIQMLKAFTPTIVIAVMKIAGVSTPSRSAIGFVLIIVVGTLMEVRGELKATMLGLVLSFTAETSTATSSVLVQRLLQNEKFSVVETMYVLAPAGAGFLALAAMILEWPIMMQKGDFRIVHDKPFWFIVAIVLGVSVNFTSFLVLQVTSSLTCRVLNIARCVALVFIGICFYGEVVTQMECVGYGVALVGIVGYNFVQVFPEQGQRLEALFDISRCLGQDRPCDLLTSESA